MPHLHDVRVPVQGEDVGRTPGGLRQVDGGDVSSTASHLGSVLKQEHSQGSSQLSTESHLSSPEPFTLASNAKV